ncbi:hypothetical protein ACQP3F_33170, partial [Escherichia coli]
MEASKMVPTETTFSKQRHFDLDHSCSSYYMIYYPTHKKTYFKAGIIRGKINFVSDFLSEAKLSYKRRESPTDIIKINIHS